MYETKKKPKINSMWLLWWRRRGIALYGGSGEGGYELQADFENSNHRNENGEMEGPPPFQASLVRIV
mgnify:CR=1 FL=1